MKTQIIRPEGDLEQTVVLEPGQKMHLVIYPANGSHILSFRLGKGTKLTIQYITTGGNNVAQLYFELEDEAKLVFDGAFRLRGDDSLNISYKTVHLSANSTSHFYLVGSLDDKAQKISSETIDFRAGAAGAIGSESERVTLFSNQAKNIAEPIILCAEENMHGTHNFSSGHLSQDTVNYLRSRGVNLETAKKIISREQILNVAKLCKDKAIIKEITEALK